MPETFKPFNQDKPKIVIDNEDNSYDTFVKLLLEQSHVLSQGLHYQQLKCKKAPAKYAVGQKFKAVEIQYELHEGQYEFEYQDNKFKVLIELGPAKIVTQCRQIEYLKRLTIFGQSFEKVKNFVEFVFGLGNKESAEDTITIYENNNGHWNISKQKRPRKLESVIFEEKFIQSVLGDIEDFIQSQDWYTEMGIPYKRSYLLYGPPGTGKSSFAQALAAHIKHSICFVNCSDQINDFQFNRLLNMAPKKSIILIEDVDAIFSQRKNTQKLNALTFSGFLNAIDGVRSQEGRIVVMTTNFKDRLDPALLRPGRVDEMYEINYATKYQIQKLTYRFYKNEAIAKEFAEKLPDGKFSMSMIQGFLLKYRKFPERIVESIDDILSSDQNVKIEVFLKQIGCSEILNDFKIEEIYTLAQAKNLIKADLERIAGRLTELLKGRLLQTIRMDRKNYIKSEQALIKFIEQTVEDEQKQRKLRKFVRDGNIKTVYGIRDELKNIETEQKSKGETQLIKE